MLNTFTKPLHFEYLQKGELSVLHSGGKMNEASDQHQATSLATWIPDWRCNYDLVQRSLDGRKYSSDEANFNAATQLPASMLLEKDSHLSLE